MIQNLNIIYKGWTSLIRNMNRFTEKQKVFVDKLFKIGVNQEKIIAEQMAERMKN